MSYKVKTIPHFERQLKKLAKKYPSLKKEYLELIHSVSEDPTKGIDLGQDCFKIRLAIKSKGKGKSGGARLISYIAFIQETVYLLSIYDKSETETIEDKYLSQLLQQIPNFDK